MNHETIKCVSTKALYLLRSQMWVTKYFYSSIVLVHEVLKFLYYPFCYFFNPNPLQLRD